MNQATIADIFQKKDYSIKDTKLTYRTVNNWSEGGLLSHLRESEGKWHKLTILELIEVYAYKELKDLGFSIDKLKKIKNIFYDEDEILNLIANEQYLQERKNSKEFSTLQKNIILLLEGQQLFLIISSNAQIAIFATSAELMEIVAGKTHMENISEQIYGSTFVVINMKHILKKAGLHIEVADEKIVSVFRMLKDENGESELRISKEGGEIKKIRTTTHRKLKQGESLNKLVRKQNQKTTIFSNNNGGIAIQIDKEIS